MLSDYLSPEFIQLKVSVSDWAEAVQAAGNILVEAGKCEKGYVQAMIDAVKDLGPYMVLAPGLAMPHARPEDGVLETGISLVTLENPVEFGSEANDPYRWSSLSEEWTKPGIWGY